MSVYLQTTKKEILLLLLRLLHIVAVKSVAAAPPRDLSAGGRGAIPRGRRKNYLVYIIRAEIFVLDARIENSQHESHIYIFLREPTLLFNTRAFNNTLFIYIYSFHIFILTNTCKLRIYIYMCVGVGGWVCVCGYSF